MARPPSARAPGTELVVAPAALDRWAVGTSAGGASGMGAAEDMAAGPGPWAFRAWPARGCGADGVLRVADARRRNGTFDRAVSGHRGPGLPGRHAGVPRPGRRPDRSAGLV